LWVAATAQCQRRLDAQLLLRGEQLGAQLLQRAASARPWAPDGTGPGVHSSRLLGRAKPGAERLPASVPRCAGWRVGCPCPGAEGGGCATPTWATAWARVGEIRLAGQRLRFGRRQVLRSTSRASMSGRVIPGQKSPEFCSEILPAAWRVHGLGACAVLSAGARVAQRNAVQ
jgi:hypothetical protein